MERLSLQTAMDMPFRGAGARQPGPSQAGPGAQAMAALMVSERDVEAPLELQGGAVREDSPRLEERVNPPSQGLGTGKEVGSCVGVADPGEADGRQVEAAADIEPARAVLGHTPFDVGVHAPGIARVPEVPIE